MGRFRSLVGFVGGFGWFWLVLAGFVGGFGWFWVVLDRFGWFWLVPCFSNYEPHLANNESVVLLLF